MSNENDIAELLHHERGTINVHVQPVEPKPVVAELLMAPTPSSSGAVLDPIAAAGAGPRLMPSMVTTAVDTALMGGARPLRNERRKILVPLGGTATPDAVPVVGGAIRYGNLLPFSWWPQLPRRQTCVCT